MTLPFSLTFKSPNLAEEHLHLTITLRVTVFYVLQNYSKHWLLSHKQPHSMRDIIYKGEEENESGMPN